MLTSYSATPKLIFILHIEAKLSHVDWKLVLANKPQGENTK
jgi:hypothetical protein